MKDEFYYRMLHSVIQREKIHENTGICSSLINDILLEYSFYKLVNQ